MTNKSKFYAYIIIPISLLGIIANLVEYGMTDLMGTLVFTIFFLSGVTAVIHDIKSKKIFYAYILIPISLIGIITHLDKYGMTNLWGTLVFTLLFLVGVTTVINDIKSKKSNDSKVNESKNKKQEPKNEKQEPKNEKQLFLDSLSPSEIKEKVKVYSECSAELKKWADLRESNSITEAEYKDKKEQGQYVNNALASISFVMKLIYYDLAEEFNSDNPSYKVETGDHFRDKEKNFFETRVTEYQRDIDIIKPEIIYLNSPQKELYRWLELRNSNAITEKEYEKIKEEFLKEKGVNKDSVIPHQIKLWSNLRDINGITEKEFQELKVYLLSKSK